MQGQSQSSQDAARSLDESCLMANLSILPMCRLMPNICCGTEDQASHTILGVPLLREGVRLELSI